MTENPIVEIHCVHCYFTHSSQEMETASTIINSFLRTFTKYRSHIQLRSHQVKSILHIIIFSE